MKKILLLAAAAMAAAACSSPAPAKADIWTETRDTLEISLSDNPRNACSLLEKKGSRKSEYSRPCLFA